MKKGFVFISVIVLAVVCTLFCACSLPQLDTPTNVTYDDTDQLSWSAVENTRNYAVELKNAADGEATLLTSRRATLSLASVAEGEYEIRVKAVGDGRTFADSPWSDVVEFKKDKETGCIYTKINNNTEYEVTKVGTAVGDVEIADMYRGRPVTRIGTGAFRGSTKVKNVVIADGITYIGDNAFYNCSELLSVTLPSSVTYIGVSAFQASRQLKTVNIPAAVTELSDYLFAYCRGIEEIDLGTTVTAIGASAFSDCSSLRSVVIPDSVKSVGEYAFSQNVALKTVTVGKNTETISRFSFYNCTSLTEVVFSPSSSLRTVGVSAFESCVALTEISLPQGVTGVGNSAFQKCSALASVSLPDSVTHVGGAAFAGTAFYVKAQEDNDDFIYADKWLIACSDDIRENLDALLVSSYKEGVVGIADEAFFGMKNLSYVEFPSTLTIIGEAAFYNCTSLFNMKISENLVAIGDSAFSQCILGQIQYENFAHCSLKTIGSYAFYGCKSLPNNNQLIPSSVTSVGTYAFKDTALWNDHGSDGIIYAGNWVVGFDSLSSSAVTLRDNVRGIADYAFYKCETLESLNNLNNARYIGRGAFYGCTSLTTVALNDNVTEIADYTFYKSGLMQIAFPRFVRSVGRSAFYKCTKLREVDLSGAERLESIGDYAFYGCEQIHTVKFVAEGEGESALTSIGDNAFYSCVSLTEAALPDSLTSLGSRAFYKCSSLTSVSFGNGLTKIGDYAFNACSSLESVVLTDNITEIGYRAFYKCGAVQSIDLKSVEKIGSYAFYGMDSLLSLTLPQTVREIGAYAFRGAYKVQSVTLSAAVTVGAHAFYGCNGATFYLESAETPKEWNTRWNSSYRPVVYGCTLSEDKTYVLSVTAKGDFAANVNASGGLSDPTREGFLFVGWSDGEEGTLTTADIVVMREEQTFYAVWRSEDAV